MVSVYAMIFYLLLLDSIAAVLVTLVGEQWYIKHFRLISRVFPPAKGWALYYLALVLWIGYLTLFAGLF